MLIQGVFYVYGSGLHGSGLKCTFSGAFGLETPSLSAYKPMNAMYPLNSKPETLNIMQQNRFTRIHMPTYVWAYRIHIQTRVLTRVFLFLYRYVPYTLNHKPKYAWSVVGPFSCKGLCFRDLKRSCLGSHLGFYIMMQPT